MSGKGNCYDNAMVETFFKTLKSELVWRTIFYTRQEADQAIGRYIDGFYNPVRRHPPSTSQARRSSKKWPPNEPIPLHSSGASPSRANHNAQASASKART